MTVSFVDNCYFNSNNSGTGDFSVANNVPGWLTPASANCADGAVYRYRAAVADESQWEVGLGTYYTTNTTLARTIIVNSSETSSLYVFAGNVAGASNTYAVYSNNGLIFQNSNNITFTSYFYGLAFGNDTFVIIASNNSIAYSKDSINWNSATNPDSSANTSTVIFSLTYSPTGFYAIDNNQHIIQSNDGITWSDKGIANTFTGLGANLNHATFIQYIGNTYFIGSDTTNNIGYSTDGSTWLSANVGFSFQKKVAFGNNTFVVIGNVNTISYSTNLTNWTATSVTAGYPRDIIYGDLGGFVSIASGNSSLTYGQVYTSSNGSSWTVSNTTYEISSNTDNIFYGMLLYDGSKYLIYNSYFFDEPIITSNNGTDWTTTSYNSSGFAYGVYVPNFVRKTNFINAPKVALTFGADDLFISTGGTVSGPVGIQANSDIALSVDLNEGSSIFQATRYANSANAPVFMGRKARGSREAPAAVQSGDTIIGFRGYGYDGTNFVSGTSGVAFLLEAAENWAHGTNLGTQIRLFTTENGTTNNLERLKIADDGSIQVLASTMTLVDANGNINSTGTISENGDRVYSPNNPPAFSGIASKPTTLSGYGITDALPRTGGTLTGNLTIGPAAGNAVLTLNRAGAGAAAVLSSTVGGIFRWVLEPGNAAVESGGNAGSDFTLAAYADDGSFIGNALIVTRKTMNATFSANLLVSGEVQTTAVNSYRHVYGNYGAFWRNDGTNLYLMLTNSGDQYGSYNSLRPFYVNLTNGMTTINTLQVANGINSTSGGIKTDVKFTAGSAGSGLGGNLQCYTDDGVLRWLVGVTGAPADRKFSIYDIVNSRVAVSVDATNGAVNTWGQLSEGGNRVYSPGNQPFIPTSSTLPVGWSGQMYNTTASTVADGATIAGSSLKTMTSAGGVQTGTWKNIFGGTVAANSAGLFVRIA